MDTRDDRTDSLGSNPGSTIVDDESETLVKPNQEKRQPVDPENPYNIKKCKCLGITFDLPLIALMIMNFLINATCSIITPFFPPLAQGRYESAPNLNLSNMQCGLVIGMHPLAGFFAGMVISKFLNSFGRQKVMLLSIVVTILTSIGVGLSYLLKDSPTAFFVVNLVCRALMGMARSGYGSSTFAYAPMLWPTKVERMIGLMESATGLGLLMGPFIGIAIAAIFTFNEGLKYQMIFYVPSLLFLAFLYPSYSMLPKDVKAPKKQATLSLFKVLGNAPIWTLFLLLSFVSASITFTYELWTVHLETYGISQNLAALLLTTASLTYIVALQTIPFFVKKAIIKKGATEFKKFLESLGIGISAFLLLLMGPETALGFPQEAWPLIVGFFFAGYAQGLAILPFIPEQAVLVTKHYPEKEKKALMENLMESTRDKLTKEYQEEGKELKEEYIEAEAKGLLQKLYNDMAAGMFMAAYGLGTFSGPTIGGLIMDFIQKSQAAVNSQCNWGRANDAIYFEIESNPCANQYGFKQLARIIQICCIINFILYMTIGHGYKGWAQLKLLCGPDRQHKRKSTSDLEENQNSQQLLSKEQQLINRDGIDSDDDEDNDDEIKDQNLRNIKQKSRSDRAAVTSFGISNKV